MTEKSKHILGLFEESLKELKSHVMTMASVAQRNLENAMRGVFERNLEACKHAIADDEEVDAYEIDVDQKGMEIIMRYGPVASDLRRVISTMKVAQNLERLSDQARNIAKRARKMNRLPEVPEATMLQPISDMAATLVRESVACFGEGNVETALELDERDGELDKAYKGFNKHVTARMEEDAEHLRVYVDLMFIARFLERIGDHAVNIGEETVFAESAYDIRHGGERPPVSDEKGG